MSTQGRRTGTRRKRTEPTGTNAAEPTPVRPPVAAAVSEPDAELVDEQTLAITGGRGTRFGRSLASGIAATVLVAGLAFGAALGPGGALGPKAPDQNDGAADVIALHDGEGSYDDGDGSEKTPDENADSDKDHEIGDDEPDATEKPDADPTDKPKPDATPKPEPKPVPKPDPTKPPFDGLALEVWIKEFHPVMEWSSCAGLDFDNYKVVRSTDSTVSWPKGENDALIGVVEPGGYRKAWDSDAPHGKKVWYRVFCVRHTDAGYKVLAASNAKGIEVPEEQAPPDPVSLDFSASINGEGKVVLDWSACEVDGFGFYKVLRSTWNEHPSYLPWNDGTEVIGVIESKDATEWLDAGGDSGQTVYYRVQCLGWIGGQKVLLGQTAVVAVTMP